MPPKRSTLKKKTNTKALNALRIASQHLNQRSNASSLAGRKISLAHPALSNNYWKTLWATKNVTPKFVTSLVGALINQEIRVRQIPPHILKKLVKKPYAEDFVMVIAEEYPEEFIYVLKAIKGIKASSFLYIQAVTHAGYLDRSNPDMHKILRLVLSHVSKDPNMLAEVVSAWVYHTHGTPNIGELFTVISKLPKSSFAAPAALLNNRQIHDMADQPKF